MKISENGYWISKSGEKHGVDISVANEIVRFFQTTGAKSILDVGCGNGYYTRKLLDAGFEAEGYDGNPYTPELTNGLCKIADFSRTIYLGKIYDWVLCLEVGEHIPQQFEFNFLTNLHLHNKKGIVLSWAVEGQGGDGHVNCHNNDYIKGRFESFGYRSDPEAEAMLRKSATNCPWFSNTIMVFRKE